MPDYGGLKATATRLLDGAGRDVQIELPGAAVDAAKPWLGKSAGTRIAAKATFVAYAKRLINGTSIQEGDQSCFVAASALPDVSTAERVIDGTKTLQVVRVRVVKPGPVVIAYELQVR